MCCNIAKVNNNKVDILDLEGFRESFEILNECKIVKILEGRKMVNYILCVSKYRKYRIDNVKFLLVYDYLEVDIVCV